MGRSTSHTITVIISDDLKFLVSWRGKPNQQMSNFKRQIRVQCPNQLMRDWLRSTAVIRVNIVNTFDKENRFRVRKCVVLHHLIWMQYQHPLMGVKILHELMIAFSMAEWNATFALADMSISWWDTSSFVCKPCPASSMVKILFNFLASCQKF